MYGLKIAAFLPIVITLAGAYFLVRLRAFFIFHPVRTLKLTLASFGAQPKRSAKALSLALAGTLGVGNITGVAVGIMVGGAGSVFWLLVSAVFAAVLKYSESVLTVDDMKTSSSSHGGMMHLIKRSFGKGSRPLSLLYSAICMTLAFFMGAALQSNTVAMTVAAYIPIQLVWIAVFSAVLTFIAVKRGGDRIEKITLVIIPLTTIIYILMSLCVIFAHFERISDVVLLIFRSAFTTTSTAGGVIGFITSRCIFEGYARGILSNEAGAGTSTLAHSRNGSTTPCREGALGMCEVLFDTVILCMLTAFVILLSVDSPEEYGSAMTLVYDAFSSILGGAFRPLLIFSILSFAFSTIICWYYYGEECSLFLFGTRAKSLYLLTFIAFVALGVYFDTLSIVAVTDVLLLLLSIICVITLIKNSDRVVTLSESENVISKRVALKERVRRRR